MKNHSLLVALLVLLVVSVSLADPLPVPEDAEETVKTDETVDSDGSTEITVEPTPARYYSPWVAGFGNLVPSVGYFLIDEPGWAAVELCMIGGGLLIIAGAARTGVFFAGFGAGITGGMTVMAAYFGGIIHAPFLAGYKNEQQKVALDLSPGVGLDSEGEAYPTVQLTLSF